MFQFKLHPHIGDIRTDILVYDKGRVIKKIKTPARVKVELSNLWQNEKCDDVEKGQIFFWKLEWHLYVGLCPPDMVWNITIHKGKIILQKVQFHIITDFFNHKGIWGWAETSFGVCSSSSENPPKNTLHWNVNILLPKHAT